MILTSIAAHTEYTIEGKSPWRTFDRMGQRSGIEKGGGERAIEEKEKKNFFLALSCL